MIDTKFIRQNPDLVKDKIGLKGYSASLVDDFLKVDEERRGLIKKLENLERDKNKIAREKSNHAQGKKLTLWRLLEKY